MIVVETAEWLSADPFEASVTLLASFYSTMVNLYIVMPVQVGESA